MESNKDKKMKECVERWISSISDYHWLKGTEEQRLKFLRSLDFGPLYTELKESSEEGWGDIAPVFIHKELTKAGYSKECVAMEKSFDFDEANLEMSLGFKGQPLEPFVEIEVDFKWDENQRFFRANKEQLQEIVSTLQGMLKEMDGQ